MDIRMAYLLGMVCGNGEVRVSNHDTTVSIEIPHKKQLTEVDQDVKIYVKASLDTIRGIIEPVVGVGLTTSGNKSRTVLSFTKSNNEYIMTEILRFIGGASVSHSDIQLSDEVFSFTRDEKINFMRGFADATGYIRRSNYPFNEVHMHRVYLEVPSNWELVAGIANLLKSLDIPIHTIDWAHPNMRDSNLKKHNDGYPNFWKKEHQIKIYANEFLSIGFSVIHKEDALEAFARELIQYGGVGISERTHRYYWDTPERKRKEPKPQHPGEEDSSLPKYIRGNHYDSWKDIARDMGYDEES